MKLLTLFLVAGLLAGVSAKPEDKTDLAIRRAISFLVTQQDKDGAIQSKWMWANKTATTALAIMSMASVGHQPADESAEGRCMRKALAYIRDPSALPK